MVKIKWQKNAKQDLFDICKYYRSVKHSPQTADNIKKALFDAARTLEMFPDQGAREPALTDNEVCFRYLVVKHHYILIYFHEKDTCHIVAVWDCRNNPTLLQDKLGEE